MYHIICARVISDWQPCTANIWQKCQIYLQNISSLRISTETLIFHTWSLYLRYPIHRIKVKHCAPIPHCHIFVHHTSYLSQAPQAVLVSKFQPGVKQSYIYPI